MKPLSVHCTYDLFYMSSPLIMENCEVKVAPVRLAGANPLVRLIHKLGVLSNGHF